MDVITSYHWQLLRVTLCWNRVKAPVVFHFSLEAIYQTHNGSVRRTITTLYVSTEIHFMHSVKTVKDNTRGQQRRKTCEGSVRVDGAK